MVSHLKSVGISDIYPFLPSWSYSLSQWIENIPIKERPALLRAIRATGQKQMRLPQPHEDTVTMASNAVLGLFRKSANRPHITSVHYLAAGTETGMDNSKALSAYILEALANSDCPLPERLSTFQVQHACAGGTIALFSICALLQLSNSDTESAVVVCSDIAHYRQSVAAEITQGAGAVGLLLTAAPRLVTLDVSALGHASHGVDDFFRPLGSLGAKVKGNYSIRCYNNALKVAMDDFAERCGKNTRQILDECDYIVMHSPFKSMAHRALHNLLATHTDYTPQQITNYIEEHGLADAIEPVSVVGNIYSASVYFVLYSLLTQQYKKIGDQIVGKKLLICSYGSGCTMTVMSGVIATGAPQVIAQWDLEATISQSTTMSDDQYRRWKEIPYAIHAKDVLVSSSAAGPAVNNGEVYLRAIREDGYREYQFQS